ncbi:MAG: RCC1 domain-containing protein [Polyangiales bacterium]
MGACNTGYLNCDSSAANGCETLSSSVTNCGACGRVCSLANAVPFCSAGACGVATCNNGYGDCNATAATAARPRPHRPAAWVARKYLCGAFEQCSAGACSSIGSSLARGAAAHHSCVLQSGSVRCWGLGTSGELGNGGTATSNVPVQVSGLTDAISIAVGASHTCAVRSTGGVASNATSASSATAPRRFVDAGGGLGDHRRRRGRDGHLLQLRASLDGAGPAGAMRRGQLGWRRCRRQCQQDHARLRGRLNNAVEIASGPTSSALPARQRDGG